MRVLLHARKQWGILISVFPVFNLALPLDDNATDRRPSTTRLIIQNAITSIRATFHLLPSHLKEVQTAEDISPEVFGQLEASVVSFLSTLERLVLDDVCDSGKHSHYEVDCGEEWPKLAALQSRLKSHVNPEAESDLTTYIDFYPSAGSKRKRHWKSLRLEITAFYEILKETSSLTSTEINRGNARVLTDSEIGFIQRADLASNASNHLLNHIDNKLTCNYIHNAMLRLSGFQEGSANHVSDFEMLVSSCKRTIHHRWTCLKCRREFDGLTRPTKTSQSICEMLDQYSRESELLQVAFDDGTIWADKTRAGTESPLDSPQPGNNAEDPVALEDLVFPMSDGNRYNFHLKDSLMVELLLAMSLLHLHSNRWLENNWLLERIRLYSCPEGSNLRDQWRVYLEVALNNTSCLEHSVGLDPEDTIVSFGLLITQLGLRTQLRPTKDDLDWETNQLSKKMMLQRLLKQGERTLDDGHREVGDACLRFQELADTLHHPALRGSQKRTAAIYNYILVPLWSQIQNSFRDIPKLFEGFPLPTQRSQWLGMADPVSLPPKPPTQFLLFDGDNHEEWNDPDKIKRARRFMSEAKDIANMIRGIDGATKIPPWQDWRRGKTRIAVVDTGIDSGNDFLIKTCLEAGSGRIRACKSFVGNSTDYQDRHGHGTHVVRLLLTVAPLAELYVAKVSDSRTIDFTDLGRIAQAIEWAHSQDVHIICLSLGLENGLRHTEIDQAIEKARGKTTFFAAASNNGANRPRAYPANRPGGVICVHASDGHGNNGGISPAPLRNRLNLTTLGISVPSKWQRDDALKSGTSFAAPIAAALACDLIDVVRLCWPSITEDEMRLLYTFDMVQAVLQELTVEVDRYDYLSPSTLSERDHLIDVVKRLIRQGL